jgi:hypothetical protein
MFIPKYDGGMYIPDAIKEAHLKSCVFFVRNDDNNCLYAALFLAYAYKRKYFQLDNLKHEFNSKHFETGRALSNYNVTSKTFNLRYFTLKLKALLECYDNATDEQVIAAFERMYEVSVCVLHEDAFKFEAVSSADYLCLLRQTQPTPHYNVLTDFVTYARLANDKYKQYNYCYEHMHWFYRKNGK